MRDIRGDLQDRANLIAEQIRACQGQYDVHIEKLKSEHQTILEDLKSALHNVHRVIGFEGRRVGSSVPATEAEPQASRLVLATRSRRNRISRLPMRWPARWPRSALGRRESRRREHLPIERSASRKWATALIGDVRWT